MGVSVKVPRCHSCGAVVNPRWRECLACGFTVEAQPPAVTEPSIPFSAVTVPPQAKPRRCRGDETDATYFGWSGRLADIARWFMDAEPPREPFQLQPGVTVAGPGRWWAAMRHDIKAGPGGARNHSGAVESDLARVAGLFRPDLLEVAEGSERLG